MRWCSIVAILAFVAALAAPASATAQQASTVLVVGDSLAEQLAATLEDAAAPGVDVEFLLSIGGDGYDSIERDSVRRHIEELDPDVTIVLVGAWDSASLYGLVGGDLNLSTSAGLDTYFAFSLRAGAWIASVVEPSREVVWLEAPSPADAALARSLRLVEQVYAAHLALHDIAPVSVASVLDGPRGGFRTEVRRPDGTTVRLRSPDGVHLCPAGGVAAVRVALGAAGPGVAVHDGWESSAGQSRIEYRRAGCTGDARGAKAAHLVFGADAVARDVPAPS